MPADTPVPNYLDASPPGMIVTENECSDNNDFTSYDSYLGGDEIIFGNKPPDLDCKERIKTVTKLYTEGEWDTLYLPIKAWNKIAMSRNTMDKQAWNLHSMHII